MAIVEKLQGAPIMNGAITGIVIIGVVALLVAANITDASAVGACITVASGAAGALGGYLTAHKQGDAP